MKKITSTIILLFLIVTCALAQNTIEDGKMLFDEKKFEQAKEIFSGLLKMSNNNHEVNYYLGLICYVSERNYDDAEEYFLKSVFVLSYRILTLLTGKRITFLKNKEVYNG